MGMEVGGFTVNRRGCICLLTLSLCAGKCYMMLPFSSLSFWLTDSLSIC